MTDNEKKTSPIEDILKKYPKKRPPLPKEYKDIYEKEYKINRNGATLITKASSYLEGWMHRKVGGSKVIGSVLEIGAGTLNHLSYEKKVPNYDVIEPFTALYEDSKNKELVRDFYLDVNEISNSEKYKRIISIAVLEHLVELPKVLAQLALKMNSQSVFQAGIPTEGGSLWKTAYKTTTGLSFWLRNKLNYDVIMKHEHVNTAHEIESIVRHIFKEVKVVRFPTSLYHMSFYTYLEAKNPDIKIAKELLHRDKNVT